MQFISSISLKIFLGLVVLCIAGVLSYMSDGEVFAADDQINTREQINDRGTTDPAPKKDPKPNTIINPLGEGNNSIPALLGKIIDVILVFAIPIIVLYIMYAGFLFVTARGDTSQISTAKSALLWAIVGGLIVLGAKVILEIMQGTLKDIL